MLLQVSVTDQSEDIFLAFQPTQKAQWLKKSYILYLSK